MNNVAAIREASPDVRALLQSRILSRLFSHRVAEDIADTHGKTVHHPSGHHVADRMALKGGMAMRVAHQSIRQTKDIDLDADHDASLACVQSAMRRAIREATAGNWLKDIRVTEPKQTATVARWKIQGTLPDTGHVIHLTVEVSFRHSIQPGETIDVPHGESPSTTSQIPVYRDEILLLNKVEAFFSPVRDAPRDVMDMFLLFQAGVSLPRATLAERLNHQACPNLVKDMWDKLERMDEARFRAEILPNWDPSQVPPEWQDWSQIRLFVAEKLEQLLQEPTHQTPPSTHRAFGRH